MPPHRPAIPLPHNFVVLRDLVETTDVGARQQLQALMLGTTFPQLFARVITSDTLLREFSGEKNKGPIHNLIVIP